MPLSLSKFLYHARNACGARLRQGFLSFFVLLFFVSVSVCFIFLLYFFFFLWKNNLQLSNWPPKVRCFHLHYFGGKKYGQRDYGFQSGQDWVQHKHLFVQHNDAPRPASCVLRNEIWFLAHIMLISTWVAYSKWKKIGHLATLHASIWNLLLVFSLTFAAKAAMHSKKKEKKVKNSEHASLQLRWELRQFF